MSSFFPTDKHAAQRTQFCATPGSAEAGDRLSCMLQSQACGDFINAAQDLKMAARFDFVKKNAEAFKLKAVGATGVTGRMDAAGACALLEGNYPEMRREGARRVAENWRLFHGASVTPDEGVAAKESAFAFVPTAFASGA